MQDAPAPQGRLTLPVVLWMSGALTAFIAAAVAIRLLASSFNVFEIGTIRLGGGLAILCLIMLLRPALVRSLSIRQLPQHLPRNIAHALGGIFWTLSIMLLPLATVFSLEFTAPAWAALMASAVLGERITARNVAGIVACLIGVLIIMRPAPGSFDTTAMFPLLAAFFLALSVLLTRKLVRVDSVFIVLFWMAILQLPINLAGALLIPTGFGSAALSANLIGTMALLAVAGLLTQYCLTQALRHGEAIYVVSIDFLRVPLIALVGFVLFGEALDFWVFVGAAFIAIGITYGLSSRRTLEKADLNAP